jgi:hypothetical protein
MHIIKKMLDRDGVQVSPRFTFILHTKDPRSDLFKMIEYTMEIIIELEKINVSNN